MKIRGLLFTLFAVSFSNTHAEIKYINSQDIWGLLQLNGEVKKIKEAVLKDGKNTSITTYEFSKDGMEGLSKSQTTNSAEYNTVAYNFNKNKNIGKLTAKGKDSEGGDTASNIIYIFDGKLCLIKKTSYYTLKDIILSHVIDSNTCDKDGKISSTIRTLDPDQIYRKEFKMAISWSEDGRIFTETSPRGDSTQEIYDKYGRIISRQLFLGSNSPYSESLINYTYDAKGNWIKQDYVGKENKNGVMVDVEKYTVEREITYY